MVLLNKGFCWTGQSFWLINQYLRLRCKTLALNFADFYNWNRIKVRYCDGSSFTGDVERVDPVSCHIIAFYRLNTLFLSRSIKMLGITIALWNLVLVQIAIILQFHMWILLGNQSSLSGSKSLACYHWWSTSKRDEQSWKCMLVPVRCNVIIPWGVLDVIQSRTVWMFLALSVAGHSAVFLGTIWKNGNLCLSVTYSSSFGCWLWKTSWINSFPSHDLWYVPPINSAKICKPTATLGYIQMHLYSPGNLSYKLDNW